MIGKFTVDLTALIKRAKGRVDLVVQKVTIDLFKSVIMKTPVDTGMARANWTASAGSFGTITVDALDKTGRSSVNAMQAVVSSTKSGGIVYMVNNLPYIKRLEYGYSKQSPQGMVRLSINEFQSFVEKAARSSR